MNSFQAGILKHGDLFNIPPGVVVALDTPWCDVQQDARNLLEKIINALHLPMEAIRLINLADVDQVGAPPSHLIIFGDPNAATLHEPTTTAQGTPVVYTHPLSKLLTDDDLRKELWTALKSMFNL